jgi:hypothetical protein
MVRVALAVGLLTVLMVGSRADARSLRDELPDAARAVGLQGGSAFDALADALADTAARTLPIVSASAGFTYRYDPTLEVFERTSDTLGPIFLERPDTLGRFKLNVNVSYQYVQLDHFDGVSTSDLRSPDPIVVRVVDAAGNLVGFTANRLRYSLRLINNVVGLSGTFGILDNLDVNLFVPIITTSFATTAYNQQVAVAGPDQNFAPSTGPLLRGPLDDTKASVGDILLRGKYQMPTVGGFRSAFGLQLRLPSGDKNNFQGTGDFEASPSYYASTLLWSRVEPHANVAFDVRSDDVTRSDFRWGLGVDADVTHRLGVALGFLGRDEFTRSASASETSFLHLTPSGTVQQEPLLGIEFDRKDYVDFSFGLRAVVWRQIMLFANGIYAVNNDGLRSGHIIPTLGFEGTF